MSKGKGSALKADKPEWTTKSYSLAYLRSKERFGTFRSVFAWLKGLGIVPHDVTKMRQVQVRNFLDDKDIDAGYLAACAFEWDGWGPSRPRDFLDALELETANCSRQDLIIETLRALGRAGGIDPMTLEYSVAI